MTKERRFLVLAACLMIGAYLAGFVVGRENIMTSTIVKISEGPDKIYRGVFFGKCYTFFGRDGETARMLGQPTIIGQACATIK